MAFTGQTVGLVLGTKGQSGTKNMAAIEIEQLILADNLTFEDVTIRKEGGAKKYNGTAITGAPKVLGGHDWLYDGSTQRSIVVTDNGDIIRDDGAGDYNGGTTLKSGLTIASTTMAMFVEGGKEAAANNKKLFVFTGRNAIQVLSGNGATTTDLSTPPTDWAGTNQPSFGLIHEDRLWGGGNGNDPHRIYYSTTGDHEDFTGSGSGSLSIFPGEGDKLVWAISFKGLIICAKAPRGLYIIDTTDPSSSNWKIARLSSSIGCAGPSTLVPIDDDILLMDSTGAFHLVSSITEFGNLGTRNLSDIAYFTTFVRGNINLAQLSTASAVFYKAKREAHFSVAGTGSVINNRRIVIDFNRIDIPRFRFSTRDTPVSLWLKADSDGVGRLTMGDNAGFVWDMDQATRSKDGSGYSAQFQTPHLDFSFVDDKLGSINKNWSFIELAVEPKGNHNLSVDIFLDDQFSETIQFNMGGVGATLGSFVLGTDALAGASILNKRKVIRGRSRRISLLGRNSGAAEDFSIAKFYFGFTVSDAENV